MLTSVPPKGSLYKFPIRQQELAMTTIRTVITALTCLLVTACGNEQAPYNAASLEGTPLTPGIAPLETAISLAQRQGVDGIIDTFLVVGIRGETIEAINLSRIGALRGVDAFTALKSIDRQALIDTAAKTELHELFSMRSLLPAGGRADRHVATGTNFPEHAEEAGNETVFNFPKFGNAGPARTSVEYKADVLLDYEVEICVRFDRDIKSLEDFDAAMKGFFLCGDFTDRATLLRLIDPDNFDAGTGFSDSKSRADFFPTGPFLVIPTDWQTFVQDERITTHVGAQIRQDARGGEMTLDFRELVAKVLADVTSDRFLYRNGQYRLVENAYIPQDAALMSGTAEGVIFMPPTGGDITLGILDHIVTGKFFGAQSGFETVIERFIDKELQSGRYLQPGDTVRYAASTMGTVQIEVTAASKR